MHNINAMERAIERKPEFAVTDSGIEIPYLREYDNLRTRLLLSEPVIRFFTLSGKIFRVPRDTIEKARENLEISKAAIMIAHDVVTGKLPGRIVPEGDPTLKYPPFEEVKLQLAEYLKQKKS